MQQPDVIKVPHSIEAEQSVLGAILLDESALDRVGALMPAHFFRNDHREIYQAILDTREDVGTIDLVTVADQLSRSGRSGSPAVAYLGLLAQNTPSAHNIRSYADIVRERALERELLATLGQIGDVVHNQAMPIRDKLDLAQAKLMAITDGATRDPVQLAAAAPAYLAELQRRATKAGGGLQTHLVDLDKKLGGVRPGNLVIVAGRPSMGKSALAFQMAEHVAMNGHSALVLSMEMDRQEVLDRAVSGATRVPLEKIISGEQASNPNIQAQLLRIGQWPLYIDDSPGLSLHEASAKARNVKRKHGLELLVIDYLQLMSGEGENRNAQISAITRGLKALAKELAVPVLAVSQLNRQPTSRADSRPQLSDLRDSGAIEQDADIVLFVHREEQNHPNDAEWRGLGEVLIRKHRQGATGDVRMTWIGDLVRFENYAGFGDSWPSVRGNTRAGRKPVFGDE